ncbi:MBL fold metallo-hydrolase [Lentisphaerota bacterium ZTH]|nr:MBL fold metallo-hydrolase [Lentisphaerota bacterium]WET06855.1 MBL fold metallo-hydrolase [Lentisphaerota bacterium ZTH]
MNITILADNTAGRDGLRGESGFSAIIETDSRNFLFDTGLGSLFARNARQLGIELYGVDCIILSHGHLDHSNGLSRALRECANARLVLHRDAMKQKFSKSTGVLHYVGLDRKTRHAVRDADQSGRVSWYENSPLAFDDALIFNAGGREKLPEGWNFYVEDSCGNDQPDRFYDEISLLLEGTHRNLLVVGCSHCSLPQIVQKAESLNNKPVGYIIGGSHLNNVSDAEIEQTANFFKTRPECSLYLGHCTGISGFSRLYHALDGVNLHPFQTGWSMAFDI